MPRDMVINYFNLIIPHLTLVECKRLKAQIYPLSRYLGLLLGLTGRTVCVWLTSTIRFNRRCWYPKSILIIYIEYEKKLP